MLTLTWVTWLSGTDLICQLQTINKENMIFKGIKHDEEICTMHENYNRLRYKKKLHSLSSRFSKFKISVCNGTISIAKLLSINKSDKGYNKIIPHF